MLEAKNRGEEQAGRTITAAEAIREGMVLALERDERVIVMGEGVTDPKGIFGTTLGLVERFGRSRVLEMPISENGWTGAAIGAALMGDRPILVHQRVEFCLLAMEQLVNNAAKLHYVSNGRHRVPLVVRLVVGRGWGQGPAHSQFLDGMFAQVPGLRVVAPSSGADAKGLLLAAVADDNPVVMLEHRWLHHVLGRVGPGDDVGGFDGPRCVRRGSDVTVVASSYMTLEALRAAAALNEVGCQAEVFDLRVIRPLVLDAIIASVERTGRLLVVDSGHKAFGVGAEICASVTEVAFGALRAPPMRLGLPDHPTPSARSLAAGYYPRAIDVAACVAQMTGLRDPERREVSASLRSRDDHVAMDVPHPEFRGPF